MSQFPGGGKRGQSDDVLFQTPGGAEDGTATAFASAEDAPGTVAVGTGLLTFERGEAEVHTTGVAAPICRLGAITLHCKEPILSVQ